MYQLNNLARRLGKADLPRICGEAKGIRSDREGSTAPIDLSIGLGRELGSGYSDSIQVSLPRQTLQLLFPDAIDAQ